MMVGAAGRAIAGSSASFRRALLWSRQAIVNLNDQVRLLPLGLVALGVTALILAYSHGALLWGSDYPGVYSIYNFISSPSPPSLVYGVSISLALGSIYLGFYIGTYFSALLTCFGAALLFTEAFRSLVPTTQLRLAALTAAALYLFNPFVLSNGAVSFAISNIQITNAFFLIFLAMIIRAYRALLDGRPISRRVAAAIGSSLGLSLTPFPNDLRLLVVAGLLVMALLVFAVTFTFRRTPPLSTVSTALKVAPLSGGFACLLGSSAILPTIIALSSSPQYATAAAARYSSAGFYTGPFNTVPNVLRLLGYWGFPGWPYHGVYYAMTPISIASYLWPLFGLVIPILFVTRRNRAVLLPLLVLVLGMMFWEKGGNPPLGGVWTSLTSVLPYGNQMVPTYFLTAFVLSGLYSILVAFSLSKTTSALTQYFSKSTYGGRVERRKKITTTLVVLSLTFGFGVYAIPILDGTVSTQVWNTPTSTSSGFHVPQSYSVARSVIEGGGGAALLLPGTTAYISTTWGYSGIAAFYNQFFAPASVITIQQFGGTYGENYSPYYQITHPTVVLDGVTSFPTNYSWPDMISQRHVKYLLVDSTIDGGSMTNFSYVEQSIGFLMTEGILTPPLLNTSTVAVYAVVGLTASSNAALNGTPTDGSLGYAANRTSPLPIGSDVHLGSTKCSALGASLALRAQIVPNQTAADPDQWILFNSSVSGGTPPYQYEWMLNGRIVWHASSVAIHFSQPGIERIGLRVNDSTAESSTSELNYTVNPSLSIAIEYTAPYGTSMGAAYLEVGVSSSATATVTGGTRPYSQIVWSADGKEIATGSEFNYSWNGPTPTIQFVNVTVTDAVNVTSHSTSAIFVDPKLSIPYFIPARSIVEVGSDVAFSLGAYLPYLPATYTITVAGRNLATLTYDTPGFQSLVAQFSDAGSYRVTATIIDAYGYRAFANTTIIVDTPLAFFSYTDLVAQGAGWYWLIVAALVIQIVRQSDSALYSRHKRRHRSR